MEITPEADINRIQEYSKWLAAVHDGRRLLTKHEVAQVLGVHPESIKRWRRLGKLPAIALGPSQIRFDVEDVAKFIAGCIN